MSHRLPQSPCSANMVLAAIEILYVSVQRSTEVSGKFQVPADELVAAGLGMQRAPLIPFIASEEQGHIELMMSLCTCS